MGWTARVIDAGAAFRNPLEDVEDGLFITSGDRRAKLSQFWVLLVLASLIAAGGVIGDATPAVIGAMIVAPLATPIYGVALATVSGSRSNLGASLLLLVEGIGLWYRQVWAEWLTVIASASLIPFEIKQVRHAKDPRNAVVEGCLAYAAAALKKLEKGASAE